MVVGLAGCASNAIVGTGTTRTGPMFGPLGLTGHNNVVNAVEGSRLGRLSIIGDGNTVTVDDGATLRKIEFWGKNNIVSIPYNLVIRYTEVGNGNQIIRRPAPWTEDAGEPMRVAEDEHLLAPPANQAGSTTPREGADSPQTPKDPGAGGGNEDDPN
jgi:hypothetical protein